MKRHKLLLGLVAGLLLLITYVIYSNWIQTEAKAVATINSTTEKTDYEGIEIVNETITHDDYSISSNYPKFMDEQLSLSIKEYIEKEQSTFIELLEEKKYDVQPNLTITTELIDGIDHTITFIVTSTSLIDTQLSSKKVFILDNQAKTLLTIDDMIDQGYLSNTVINKLITDYPPQNDVLLNTIEESLNNHTFLTNAYLTDNELHVIISNDLTHDTITIPLTSIVFALKEPYKTMIQEKIDSEKAESSPKKKVALTFDDGPHATHTQRILASLEKYNAKATFFMLGRLVDKYPTIAQEVSNAGHEIGSHTWAHENLKKLSISKAVETIQRTNEKIFETTGIYPTLYRPPYGEITEAIDSAIPMQNIMWSIDTKDWKSRNARKIVDVVKNQLHDGAIILLHDIHKETADSLDHILAYIQEQGYECVTISELNK